MNTSSKFSILHDSISFHKLKIRYLLPATCREMRENVKFDQRVINLFSIIFDQFRFHKLDKQIIITSKIKLSTPNNEYSKSFFKY